MPTSVNKGYELQATGTNTDTWGTVLNEDVFEIVDRNLGGLVSKSLTNVNVTLTAEESQNLILRLTGALSGAVEITTACVGMTIVENLTTNAFAVTFTNGVGTPVTLVQGVRNIVITDGTNGPRLLVAPASTSIAGSVELATDAETQALADTGRAVTPSNLAALTPVDSRLGLIELATQAEVTTGTDAVRAVTPATLQGKTASDTALGIQRNATKAEMEAAASTGLTVSPGRQHFHPGHPKAGGNFNGGGTPAFRSGDYGMGAITDVGTGRYTLALDTAFNDTNYWATGWARGVSGSTQGMVLTAFATDTKTTSAFGVLTEKTDEAEAGSPEAGIMFWGAYA